MAGTGDAKAGRVDHDEYTLWERKDFMMFYHRPGSYNQYPVICDILSVLTAETSRKAKKYE